MGVGVVEEIRRRLLHARTRHSYIWDTYVTSGDELGFAGRTEVPRKTGPREAEPNILH